VTPFYTEEGITLYCADARTVDLSGVAAAVVTSPPYNVGLGYEGDDQGDALPWPDYWALAAEVAGLMARALVSGGRAWVNTAVSVPEGTGSVGPRSGSTAKRRVLLANGWANALTAAGLDLVDQVAWSSVRAGGTAWGSWQSPAAPNLRGDYEAVTVACRDGWERTPPPGAEGWRDTLGAWPALCSTVWHVPTVGGRIPPGTNTPGRRPTAHPAPMPVEVARRAIRLSTWPGETVLDPFAGSGTTLLAARQLGRQAIGIERSEAYCALTVDRLSQRALDFGGAA
jgi:site-specific DNA-methyltransferase (adenine-specific)